MASWIGPQALEAHTTAPIRPVDYGNSVWRPIHPWSNGLVGAFAFSYTAARWGIAASPAALSFIQGVRLETAPGQRVMHWLINPPKTPVVLRDSGGTPATLQRHAPIRGGDASEVG